MAKKLHMSTLPQQARYKGSHFRYHYNDTTEVQ